MKTRLKKILARVPRSLVSAAVLALLLLLAVAAFKNYRQLQVAQDREEILRQRIEDRRLAVEGLDRQLVRLRENPASLERLARENLGMAYGDELVLILPDESRPALIEAVPIEPVPAESMAARESPALLESTAALESPVRD